MGTSAVPTCEDNPARRPQPSSKEQGHTLERSDQVGDAPSPHCDTAVSENPHPTGTGQDGARSRAKLGVRDLPLNPGL